MEGVRFKTLHSLGPELAFPRLDSDPVMLSGLTFPLSLALSDFFFRVSFLLRYTLPDGCRMAAASPDLTLSQLRVQREVTCLCPGICTNGMRQE